MGTDRERLLAQFNKKTGENTAAVLSGDGEEYQAFKAVDLRQLSLHIRPASEPWQWAKYSYLLHIVADPGGTRLDVVFSFLVVTIKGRNLLEVGHALANERCDFIQAFDAGKWARPSDTSAAFIESIGYLMNRPPESIGEKKETETA